jgi:ribose 5-phosphate isomerase A
VGVESPARAAAAAAAAGLVRDGMTIGLGSGRAVWAVLELLRGRDIRAAVASSRTEELLREADVELVELDGTARLELAIDGADEIDARLGAIKGGGAALLREKLLVCAADRFVIVCEASKRVERLGQNCALPVEVVRFAWGDTRRRLLGLVESAELRTGDDGAPIVTDEGHLLLDCRMPASGDLNELASAIKSTVGVVEHGLFLGLASLALVGNDDGSVERLEA